MNQGVPNQPSNWKSSVLGARHPVVAPVSSCEPHVVAIHTMMTSTAMRAGLVPLRRTDSSGAVPWAVLIHPLRTA